MMAATLDEALLNATEILDKALGALRVKVDPVDWESTAAMFDSLRAVMYGFTERADVTKGVVFGLDTCYFSDIGLTWNLFGPSPTTDPLADGPDGNDLVITRGSIYDGSGYVNFEPDPEEAYVHLVTIPTIGGSNCLASGGIYWDTGSRTFRTILKGGETAGYPPVLLEKAYCSTERFLESAFGNNPTDGIFLPTETSGLIRLARLVVDVSESGQQSLYAKIDKLMFPMPPGQPSTYCMAFGNLLSAVIEDCMKTYYDSTLVSSIVTNFCSAEIWGGFATYWTTGGRSCPANVWYYYDRIFNP